MRPLSTLLFHRAGIGGRLLVLIMLFSAVITLLSTVVELSFDYQRDVSGIEVRLDEIERANLNGLASSLWNLDYRQLRLQLDGIHSLPDIQTVEITESKGANAKAETIRVGQRAQGARIVRKIPLVYVSHGKPETIGTFYIEATLANVWRRIFDKILVILVAQTVKTFLVSLFILYIVSLIVTRHLEKIANFVDAYDIRKPFAPLALAGPRPRQPNELDRMVSAFNNMCVALKQSYTELQEDIAARKRAENEIIRLNQLLERRVQQRTAALEAANQELGSFNYSLSHDLRGPLRRIEGFTHILLTEFPDDSDGARTRYLERIRSGVLEISSMIESFLQLSRTTVVELASERVDLSALAREVVDELKEGDPQRQTAVDIEPGMAIEADRRMLKIVLQNLLGNAWKYTRNNPHATIRFGSERKDGATTFYVRDEGVGFDMAKAHKLFKPFSRLHPPAEFEGTGIGLATVQRIVVRHGGKIWVESSPGAGACFYFQLGDHLQHAL
jgi:signal transduction histidine kinase